MEFSHDCFNDQLENPTKQCRWEESIKRNRIGLDDAEDLKRVKLEGEMAKVKRIYIDDFDDVAGERSYILEEVGIFFRI